MTPYADPREVTARTVEILRPARRMKPSTAAIHHKLKDKDGNDWSPTVAPYMVEPLDALGDRRYQAIVFVGPARTSKTFSLVHAAINYAVTCDPGDMSVIQMSKDTARSFSREEIDPVFRKSEGLAARHNGSSRHDNTFDKRFRNGMNLNFGWPAVTQLSGKTRKYMLVTDYDRPENRDNVDGEGPLFDLAFKRIQTYGSRGKCVVESSPGEDTMDPKWAPTSPHEAPPAQGIASLHNRGTMARWYWPCLHCGTYMQAEPGTKPFGLPGFKEAIELVQLRDSASLAAEYARIVCTADGCGGIHHMEDRPAMQARGCWVHDGETIDRHGAVTGTRRNTHIASYWLGGVAAAFQRWDSMLAGYFEAIRVYAQTGDEASIRAKTNLDFGASYMPRAAANRRKAEDLLKRAEHWTEGTVPEGVHYLTAAIDVQAHRFVVSVFGWGEGNQSWVVDRFTISHSGSRMEGERPALLDPATYIEDWNVLIDDVICKSYPLAEDPTLRMPIYVTGCDSGGAASSDEDVAAGGVTQRAYDFWRSLGPLGYQPQFKLLKGASSQDAKRIEERYPDAKNAQERLTGARGDVPVWFLNTTTFKDAIVGDLGVLVFGPGYVHIPKWLKPIVVAEWVAESRTDKGWQKKGKRGNEQFDLHGYNRALIAIIGSERINWQQPDAVPPWARRPVSEKAALAKSVNVTAAPEKTLAERRRERSAQLNG